MIGDPELTYREQRHYLGIRTIAPFRGMFAVRDAVWKELRHWLQQNDIPEAGPYFLRYNVIDMEGPMDIEVGMIVAEQHQGDGRVTPGVLPAGQYASLIYSRYGLRGNKALLNWIAEQGLRLDRWDDPAGDAFRCRYEAYLTDFRTEPRKTAWQVEVAIKVLDS